MRAVDVTVINQAQRIIPGLSGWYARAVIDGHVHSAVRDEPWDAIGEVFADADARARGLPPRIVRAR